MKLNNSRSCKQRSSTGTVFGQVNSSFENNKKRKPLTCKKNIDLECTLKVNAQPTKMSMSLTSKRGMKSSASKSMFLNEAMQENKQLSKVNNSSRKKLGKKLVRCKSKNNFKIDSFPLQDNRLTEVISSLKRKKRRLSLLCEKNIESGRSIHADRQLAEDNIFRRKSGRIPLICKKNILGRSVENESTKAKKSKRKKGKRSPLYGKPATNNCMPQVNQCTTAINSLKKKGKTSLVLENSVTNESIPQANQSSTQNNSLKSKKRKKSPVQKKAVDKSMSQANRLSISRYSLRSRTAGTSLMNEIDIDIDSFIEKSPEETRSSVNKINKSSDFIPVTSTPIAQCHVKRQKCFILDTCAFNLKSKNPKLSEIQPNKVLPFKLPKNTEISSTFSVTLRSRQSMPLEEKQSNIETGQKKRHLIKSPKRNKQKSQSERKAKTFTKEITIDDLALSENPIIQRKARSEGFKVPNRNSLKRKRFVINELKRANEDYEDDIYEAQKFDFFKDVLEETTESSEMSFSMPTPKLGFHVTPKICKSTPIYKDCISPSEYALNRKIAEECFYRNKKRKNETSEEKSPGVPEKKKLEFSQVLVNVQKKQKEIDIVLSQSTDNENSYFSDC